MSGATAATGSFACPARPPTAPPPSLNSSSTGRCGKTAQTCSSPPAAGRRHARDLFHRPWAGGRHVQPRHGAARRGEWGRGAHLFRPDARRGGRVGCGRCRLGRRRGVVADALSDRGLRTLVLEAGSYLFPTHVANLPRAHRVGEFDKHVWGLFNEPAFRRQLYANEPGSAYAGASGYNLGGRSIFWGAFAPRMRPWEFTEGAWPAAVRDDLLRDGGYFDRAEALLKVGPPRPSAYQEAAKALVSSLLGPDFVVADAPMAVQRQTSDRRTLSAGVWSTADLLMESSATRGPAGSDRLAVNLNHDVTRIDVGAPGRPTTVHATDRLAFVDRTYRGRAVVVAAGTLESPKIGALSRVPDASGTLGYGLTDHPVWFTHFGVPSGAPLFSDEASAKLLIHPATASPAAGDGWNAVLELGADYNQGRYVDDDILAAHRAARDAGRPTQLCELVFLASSPLDEGGFALPRAGAPAVAGEAGRPMRVRAVPATANVDALLASAGAVQRHLLHALHAEPLGGSPPTCPSSARRLAASRTRSARCEWRARRLTGLSTRTCGCTARMGCTCAT
eukprot:TRINITY_DN2467_c0_g1_i6.p1 TRINITY_DN2467_c0_g1~~TRINITY_DN2467_c0_g1_i6.p1  ORF type:complete len:563 (-),score=132.12 TRINITY_DN2467_c0_g1_i6:453-2141(-)